MSGKCVSVIMPIYNGEKELNRSVKSVLEQSHTNLQLILIDDGSTDKTYDICMEFKKKDARVEVFRLKNGGVSASRNFALDYVKGDYITFLDSDDAMKKNAIATMLKNIENVDLVVCSYYKEFNSRIRIPVERLEMLGEYSSKEYLCNTLRDPGHHYYGVVWNKMYRTDIIQSNNIRFDVEVNLGEDFIFNLSYLLCASKVKVLWNRLILYNKGKTRTLSQNKSKKLEDCIVELNNRKKIYINYAETFKKAELYEKYKQDIHFYWIIFYIRQVHDVYTEYDWSYQEKADWISDIEKDAFIKESLEIVPKRKIERYRRWYGNNYEIKRIVKKIGGIK